MRFLGFLLPANVETPAGTTPSTKWIKRILTWTLALVTLLAVGRQFWKALESLPPIGLTLRPTWLLAAAGWYAVGLIMLSLPWWRIMRGTGSPSSTLSLMRAYLISHLGKYVPGKIMVPVLRLSLLRRQNERPARVIVGTVYETLLTMAVGSWLGLICVTLLQGSQWLTHTDAPAFPVIGLGESAASFSTGTLLWLLAAGLTGAFSLAVLPVVFHHVVRILASSLRRQWSRLRRWSSQETSARMEDPDNDLPEDDSADETVPLATRSAHAKEWVENLPRPTGQVLLQAAPLSFAAWLCWALAFWCCLQGSTLTAHEGVQWDWLIPAAAGLALSLVGGFLSMVPGQIGVRDWLLAVLLQPAVGPAAVVASVMFRLITLCVELLVALVASLGARS